MARSSRGRGRTSSRRRNVDWVVNDETYGTVFSLPNATQSAAALTLPRSFVYGTDPTLAIAVGTYQLPEQDSGQVAYAVRGQYSLIPSTWASGSFFTAMVRLVKKPIEVTGGIPNIILDASYSLFQPPFANERFLWQRYHTQQNALGSVPEVHSINWKGVCKLEPDEALWLVFENQSGITMSLGFRFFMRTLMRADG